MTGYRRDIIYDLKELYEKYPFMCMFKELLGGCNTLNFNTLSDYFNCVYYRCSEPRGNVFKSLNIFNNIETIDSKVVLEEYNTFNNLVKYKPYIEDEDCGIEIKLVLLDVGIEEINKKYVEIMWKIIFSNFYHANGMLYIGNDSYVKANINKGKTRVSYLNKYSRGIYKKADWKQKELFFTYINTLNKMESYYGYIVNSKLDITKAKSSITDEFEEYRAAVVKYFIN